MNRQNQTTQDQLPFSYGSRWWLAVVVGLLMVMPSVVGAQLANKIPAEEEGTGVEERLGDFIDLDIPFRDEANDFVKIGKFFDGKRPVILSFNYSNCPKLCSVQLEKMAEALARIDLFVDRDFHVVSVSIDPNEQSSRSREFKERFTLVYGMPEYDGGWHFLTGAESDIKALASQCGVTYKYIPEQKLFSHPPVFLLLSPDGKIVRYILGLDYEPITVKRALVEAADGKIGSTINRLTFLTGCYLYNDSTGQYTMQAMAIMRIGGVLTILGLSIGLMPYWFMRRYSRKKETSVVSAVVSDENAESENV